MNARQEKALNHFMEIMVRDMFETVAGNGDHNPSDLVRNGETSVTPGPLSPAERTRRHRARKKAAADAPLFYERDDWQLFIDRATLPQKAGCQPRQILDAVVKELVDNGLDNGADVRLEQPPSVSGRTFIVRDDGPGIDPAQVPILFAVNRGLLSSKLKRLPLRGMLGNGLRVVMGGVTAEGGSIAVTTRGHRLELQVDTVTGKTKVTSNTEVPITRGTAVEINLPWRRSDNFIGVANQVIRLAQHGAQHGAAYSGPSHPIWYGPEDFHRLAAHVLPESTTVAQLVRDVFQIDLDDRRCARDLDRAAVCELHPRLCAMAPKPPADIGHLGPSKSHYSRVISQTQIGGAKIPFTVEAFADAERVAERSDGHAKVRLFVNRTQCLSAMLQGYSQVNGLWIVGQEVRLRAQGAKVARYDIAISLITPYVQLTSDGKSPDLAPFEDSIEKAVSKAAMAAYRAIVKPPKKMSIVDAAWRVMEEAYLEASTGGTLPANARQIMYRARPLILELTGIKKFNDAYFTQTILPDYVNENADECADWDVVFDARGHFIEPHTRRSIPIGTVEVREYLGDRPGIGPSVRLVVNARFPTSGPENRYGNVLFVEKEGFDPLLQAARIAERFDIAIMSTKGLSVTAARMLLDRLAPKIGRVFVLRDFDVSGFSISGTLTTDSRRYKFKNTPNRVELGLRLVDVEAMGLESEPVTIEDWEARAETLERHGATDDEIDFLLGSNGNGRRVELNAMTSGQFVEFIERKLTEFGVEKVVPDTKVISEHARRLIEQKLAEQALDKIRGQITAGAAAYSLPTNLADRVRALLAERRQLAWDDALAMIIGGLGI